MPICTRLPLAAAALALLALATLPAAAQWKWRDANGRVTISDTPPRGIPDKDILQRPAAPARAAPAPAEAAPASAPGPGTTPAAPGAAKGGERELEARKRAAEQERQAKAKADEEAQAAQRADNCRRARSQLAMVDSGQRMVRLNDKGEREFLDDGARAAEARKARDVIASDCR